jgi:hypothetical protein
VAQSESELFLQGLRKKAKLLFEGRNFDERETCKARALRLNSERSLGESDGVVFLFKFAVF